MASTFGAIWEDSEGGFIKFVVKRASNQDQTLHMEGKLHVILYFMEGGVVDFGSGNKEFHFSMNIFSSSVIAQANCDILDAEC